MDNHPSLPAALPGAQIAGSAVDEAGQAPVARTDTSSYRVNR